jgi:hypothetical protein
MNEITLMPEHTDPHSGLRYVASYSHNGRVFTVDIWAHDWNEAQQKVKAIRAGLILDGQVYMREDIEGGMQ